MTCKTSCPVSAFCPNPTSSLGMPFLRVFVLTLTGLSSIYAQTGASIVHLGYEAPRDPKVAPGQALPLTLHGLTTVFDSTQVATTLTLPTNFSGLSVLLQQSGSAKQTLLPLLHGEGAASCNRGLAGALFPRGDSVSCSADDQTYDLAVHPVRSEAEQSRR